MTTFPRITLTLFFSLNTFAAACAPMEQVPTNGADPGLSPDGEPPAPSPDEPEPTPDPDPSPLQCQVGSSAGEHEQVACTTRWA